MVLRLLTGLGLGAAVPLGVVIVNEFAPKRRRAAMVTLMGCGYAMGSASGGLLASNLVPTLGWPAQFYVASALTLFMAVVLWTWLPESIRLLTVKGRDQEVAAILRKINPALSFPRATRISCCVRRSMSVVRTDSARCACSWKGARPAPC